MPDLKISQLTGGGAAQAADEFPNARSGANFKITGANIAAAATSVGTLTSLTVSGDLTVDTSTLKVDSAGNAVGIGTSSPSGRLDVAGSIGNVRVETTGNKISFTRNGANYISAAGGASVSINYEAPIHYFNSGDGVTTRMTLDNSGNLGLGVTPSAWSGIKAFEFGTGTANGSLYSLGNDTTLSANVYYSGGFKYVSTSTATRYQQSSGQHIWYNAPSGTAGNAISFTQAMTLDANGKLMVNTTTVDTNAQLEVKGNVCFRTSQAANTNSDGRLLGGSYTGNPGTIITYSGTSGINKISYGGDTSVGEPATSHAFFTGTAGAKGAGTEKMTLDASGNLGVGTSSPSGAFNVVRLAGDNYNRIDRYSTNNGHAPTLEFRTSQQNTIGNTATTIGNVFGRLEWYGNNGSAFTRAAYIGATQASSSSTDSDLVVQSGGTIAFQSGGTTERARITSGGYFKASNSGSYLDATGNYHELRNNVANQTVAIVTATNASYTGPGLQVDISRNTTNNTFYAYSYYNRGAGAYRFYVADSGSIATAGSITLGSVTPATSGVGVQFPATQSASTDANTLDDYEEGVFDPTITFGGASVGVTYNTSFTKGSYTKVGNRVFVGGYIILTSKGSSTGDASIGGLPFTSASGNTRLQGATVALLNVTFANQFWARIAANVTTIDFYESTEAGVASTLTNADFANNSEVYFTAHYAIS